MSYLGGNTSDIELEKNEFPRSRPQSSLITKMAAHKLSSEPKWTDKRGDEDTDSEVSMNDNFLAKGAFLLTPSYELSMERAAMICEKMTFKGCFSLTKTATGILFKFSHPEDYQAIFKKGFHKVTGARFYRKIAIPCRPRKTFTLYVLDVPEDIPVEDIRHSLYRFDSVVEVVRIHVHHSSSTPPEKDPEANNATPKTEVSTGEKTERHIKRELAPAVIRVTLASMDEYNILLQNGLNFYDATFFPTEANIPLKGAKIEYKRRMLDGSIPGRVRELLPVFDAAGFCKIPPPSSKLIKPPRS
ncbi:uncharacterized protein LOC129947852 [Eupeodes corollae]|uniref:uncharacterized protein LOC129947852 n=1 Tax=Eupeodes corollae TaxID=290404 RepID=UPI002492C0E8|nr:uncharacterized protein LOC129947852 [Eupeodes corollae]